MTDDDHPVPAVLAALPSERQARIKARAAELVAEEFALRDLGRPERITQAQVAAQTE